jgi:hypothetical protein
LNWLNKKYISELVPPEDIALRGQAFVPAGWKLTPSIIDAVKTRLEKLSDLEPAVRLFFENPEYPAELLYWKDKKGKLGKSGKAPSVVSGWTIYVKTGLESAVFAIVPRTRKGSGSGL